MTFFSLITERIRTNTYLAVWGQTLLEILGVYSTLKWPYSFTLLI